MAGRGGARTGAGRKPLSVNRVLYPAPIQTAEAKIAERLPWLIDQMFLLAKGVQVQKIDSKGRVLTWIQPPDRAAIEYLMNRVMGMPKQPVDITIRQEAERISADLGMPLDEVQEEVERILAARGVHA